PAVDVRRADGRHHDRPRGDRRARGLPGADPSRRPRYRCHRRRRRPPDPGGGGDPRRPGQVAGVAHASQRRPGNGRRPEETAASRRGGPHARQEARGDHPAGAVGRLPVGRVAPGRRRGGLKMAEKTLKVTLKRSLIGEKPKTRATAETLGRRKIRQTVEHPDTPVVRGMLHRLRPAPGSKKSKIRVGRGESGKRGKTAGRGTKGLKARGKLRPGFEGGQTPLSMRLPKLPGFKNPNKEYFAIVNLETLNQFD